LDGAPLGELVVGASVEHTFVVSPQDMMTFQSLSADDSLIHTDAEFSARHGFRAPIVYGGILLAHLSHVLGTIVPGRQGISLAWNIAYRKPLYVNETATLTATIAHVSEATNTINLTFKITRGGETIATGKTESMVLR
jgi:acyl dehydratase